MLCICAYMCICCVKQLKYKLRNRLLRKEWNRLVVSDLRSETKGSRFESGCYL